MIEAFTDLVVQKSEAKRLQESDPKRSLEILKQSAGDGGKGRAGSRRGERLVRSADRSIADVEQYIETNRPRIELDERNKSVKNEIDREQQVKVEAQEKLA